jgi:hypothetical protein
MPVILSMCVGKRGQDSLKGSIVMETFLLIIVLALLALSLILFLELRSMQRRVDTMRGEVEQRIRQGLSEAAGPMAQIPNMEQRLQKVERGVADLQPGDRVAASGMAAALQANPPAI